MKDLTASLTEQFNSGECSRAHEFLGSHLTDSGCLFSVWAPEALAVCVTGSFNDWNDSSHPMKKSFGCIWQLEIPDITDGCMYKYVISTRDGQKLWKADPYSFRSELRPGSASIVCDLAGYNWQDEKWLRYRRCHKVYDSPMNVYEVHLGSWKRNEDGSFMTYREAAQTLVPYVKQMNFTHIEFMPFTEYPYDGSWGYQCTGYFAATSRYGEPEDLMFLIDKCHEAGLGVIMDWVPAHFPKDPHGLVEFDGSRLYEDSDPQMAEHPSWGTRIFDYSKGGVRSFLISSALFWLENYHIDGLRVDAVASMLYLDYDRQGQPWRPNIHGGNENYYAVKFLRDLNSACFAFDDSISMIAEESTAWPMVTAPTDAGGLGFNLKWNMGWMNDTLRYIKTDPYFRSGAHNHLTFSLTYAFSENFILPLSHDEVVHLKGSIANKSAGSREEKLATLRVLWAYMLAHPGKKLLFMGAELGQESEWDFASQLPWDDLQYSDKSAVQEYFREMNKFYLLCKPLWQIDFNWNGFRWICPDERDKNIIGFMRSDKSGHEIIFLCSFCGKEQQDFYLGVPGPGSYKIVMSTDDCRFGGNGQLCSEKVYKAVRIPQHGLSHSIIVSMPPLCALLIKRTRISSPPSYLQSKSNEREV